MTVERHTELELASQPRVVDEVLDRPVGPPADRSLCDDDAVLAWLAILALAAFGLIKLIDRRSGTGIPHRGESTTLEGGSGARAVRDLGCSALAGVAGSLVSIVAGMFAAAVTMDPDEGATFVAIWFWLAGPPVSAVAMAVVVLSRHWDPLAPGRRQGPP